MKSWDGDEAAALAPGRGALAWAPGRLAPRGALRASADTAARAFILAAVAGVGLALGGIGSWGPALVTFMWVGQSSVVNGLACLAMPRRGFAQLPRAAKAFGVGLLEFPALGVFIAAGCGCWLRGKIVGPGQTMLGEHDELLWVGKSGELREASWLLRLDRWAEGALERVHDRSLAYAFGDPASMTQAGAWRAARSWLAKAEPGEAAKAWQASPFNPGWLARMERRDSEGLPAWRRRWGRELPFVDALEAAAKALPRYESSQADFALAVARIARVEMESGELARASAPASGRQAAPRRARSL